MIRPKTFWWILIIVWCGFIFNESSKPFHSSQQQSLYIVKVLNESLSQMIKREVVVFTNHLVRKSAHCFEYFILGCLLLNGFFTRNRMRRAIIFSLLFGVCYAASDEFHQLFVPGREMHFLDVLIDSTGVSLGVLLVSSLRKKRRFHYSVLPEELVGFE